MASDTYTRDEGRRRFLKSGLTAALLGLLVGPARRVTERGDTRERTSRVRARYYAKGDDLAG